MKKIILIITLLITNFTYGQLLNEEQKVAPTQEFGNWHYKIVEYQTKKTKDSDWKTEKTLGQSVIQFVKYKKSFKPIAEISVVGEIIGKYYVLKAEKLKEGEHYCQLKSLDGSGYAELLIVEGDYAILLFGSGIERAVFHVK